MCQTSLIARLSALLVGIHLAGTNSAWAGPTASNRITIAPKQQGVKGNGNQNVQKTSSGTQTAKGTTSTSEGGGTNTPCNSTQTGSGTGAQGGGNSNQNGSGSGSQNGGGNSNQNGSGSGSQNGGGSGNQNGGNSGNQNSGAGGSGGSLGTQLNGQLYIPKKRQKTCTSTSEPQTLADEIKRLLNKGK